MAGTAVESHAKHELKPAFVDGIDPLDEPSAAWGWHGHSFKLRQLLGWAVVAFLLLMAFFGNHNGKVEVVWSVAIAVLMAGGLLWDAFVDRGKKDRLDPKRDADYAAAQEGTGGAMELVPHLRAQKKAAHRG